MAEQKTVSTATQVDDPTKRREEPTWMKEARLASWESYLSTQLPGIRDDGWHRTDISGLNLADLRAVDFHSPEASASVSPWVIPALDSLSSHSGVLIQEAGTPAYLKLDSELADKGVVFCDIETALKTHGDKVRRYLGEPADLNDDKFTNLIKSWFNCGLFLFVPPGVEIANPLLSFTSVNYRSSGIADGAVLPRLLVVASEGSRVTLLHSVTAPLSQAVDTALHAGLVDIHIEQAAHVSYLELTEFGPAVYSVTNTRAWLNKDASFTSLTAALGGRLVKGEISTYLNGQGASAEVAGVVLGADNEKYSFNTIEEHNAPDTRSNIHFRTALKDSSTSIYQGIIRVDREAQRTDAYQSNKNLLLGSGAKADSIPKLEILADDVRCSHGATVGPVDQEQVFYLMSRGLTAAEAEELIVLGFFTTVMAKFDHKPAIAWVGSAIASKLIAHDRDSRKQSAGEQK